MLRPKAQISLSLDASLPRLVRPLHVSAVRYKVKKVYRGEPPKRPKPKEHPRAPSAIGIPHVQKREIPEKIEAGATSVKEKKDPLQGMREAREMSRMVKYPAAAAQQVATATQLPSKDEDKVLREPTAGTGASAGAIRKDAAGRSGNMPPVPTMLSNAPRGGPYKPPPPKSSPNQTKFIIAAIAGTFFLGGAYMAFGPGSSRADPLTTNSLATGGPTPKEKPLPASLKRALELLKAYFKERASTLDEDVEEFSGVGIIGIGGGKNFPKMVVYPESTEEVEIILNICQKYGVAVIPYSGGTSLEGQCVPVSDAVTVSLQNMNKIIEFRPNDMDVTLQPGISWTDLNAFLKPYNLFLPVDPGPNAHIGGMISTSASGTNAVRYGTMKDWVLNMKVVLPGGHVMKTRSRARKSSTGYDLTRLFCGSEGTLGVITEVTLKLAHLPEKEIVGSIAFENNTDAAKAVSNVLKSGLEPRCVELLDTTCITAVNTNLPPTIPPFNPKPHLFFKLTGSNAIIPQQQKTLVSILKSSGGTDLRLAKTVGEGETLWEIRKNLVYSLISMFPGSGVIGTDACVPVSRLAGLIDQYKVDQEGINAEIEREGNDGNEALKGRKLASLILGHVGDGNFHSLIAYEKGNEEMKKKAQQLESSLVMNAIAMDGTCSGEHGVGIHKIPFLNAEYDATALTLMRAIKAGIDPKGIMNPGTLLPPATIEEQPPLFSTIDVQTLNEWIIKPKSLEDPPEVNPHKVAVATAVVTNPVSAAPKTEGGSWFSGGWNGISGVGKSVGGEKTVEKGVEGEAGKSEGWVEKGDGA